MDIGIPLFIGFVLLVGLGIVRLVQKARAI